MDFGRLSTSDVDLELTEVDFQDGEFHGKLKHLSLEEQSGFVLNRLSVEELLLSPTGATTLRPGADHPGQ